MTVPVGLSPPVIVAVSEIVEPIAAPVACVVSVGIDLNFVTASSRHGCETAAQNPVSGEPFLLGSTMAVFVYVSPAAQPPFAFVWLHVKTQVSPASNVDGDASPVVSGPLRVPQLASVIWELVSGSSVVVPALWTLIL